MCWPELWAKTVLSRLHAVGLPLALLAAGTAQAQAPAQGMEAARAAWVEGNFQAAAELAAGLGTADGHALAAESLATFGYFSTTGDEQAALYAESVRHAEAALALAPESVYATLQLAQAIGRVADTAGVRETIDKGYARRTRDLLEAAAALDPESALAHSGIALWHARALDEGGLVARMMFDASRKDALEHVELAIELAIENRAGVKRALHDAASALLILSERRHGERARELLREAREIPSLNALDDFVQQRIEDLLAQLDT